MLNSWQRRALPARLLLLLALALTLGALSVGKLRWGWDQPALPFGVPAEEERLPQSYVAGNRAPEDDGDRQRQQQHGSCFAKFPWVNEALDEFYVHAWRAANASTQTTEQALQALRGVMWNKYHPGTDEIVLRLKPGQGEVEMEVIEVSRPNQVHKKRCILEVLRGAVQRHSAELAALLEERRERELRFMVGTEDFGIVWRGDHWKLPAFSMCTDDGHSDIPVPDFTYACYPEARYKNSSWPAIQELLQHKSDMLHWHERHSELMHRSNWGVGPRRGLMPLLQSYLNGSAGMSAREALGADLDIENTGFVEVREGQARGKHDTFVWLDGQCDYKYLIHTAGFSYSAALKYKLACGSLVFKFDSQYKEFYEPALKDGVHVVRLPAKEDGVDVEEFKTKTAPRIKSVVERTLDLPGLPPIALAGQKFVREQLTMEAVHCYWFGALQRYMDLYYLPKTPAQLAKEAEAGGAGDAGSSGGGSVVEGAGGQADSAVDDDSSKFP